MALAPESIPNYYWDTCIFVAYLADEREAYGRIVDDIGQFLSEAQRGECRIHCSTVTMAEITKSDRNQGRNFDSLHNLFGGGIVPVSPDPNAMRIASELRSLTYIRDGSQRQLHTVDAIHLASAITLSETYGVALDAFHTFDKGKKKDGKEGKSVPLIGFEDWCQQCSEDLLARKVIALKRGFPEHPNRTLV